jgi:diguanylate cyclase (GGDEF)-like protein
VIETVLRQASGTLIPVELVARPVTFANQPRQAVAVRDIRARKKAEADLRHLAQHDSLTGLPNRRSFNGKLDREVAAAAAGSGYLALLCLDLDRFKEVNDLFGHAAGDLLLQAVARCTSATLRDDQMLARLGGDEFAVIAPGLSEPAQAGRIAETIIEAFRLENATAPNGGLISGSIGIAIYPGDAVDSESLMSHADTALYRAKVEGRGTYRFFEAAMGAEVKERRHIEHELLHAISRGELSLAYQPQKRLTTGEILGFEALLRWHHRERGNISPSTFIPIAEECGLIRQIGEWVLRAACREAATWERPLVVAVNVSAVQLHSAQFAQLVHEVLLQTGLGAHRLELEITETALVRDKNRALATLRQLKNLGVRIAMDDFGTGYSSLSNLRAFPFDKIKIDGSFVRSVDSNQEAATIVRAVLGLGRGLGLPVLAEGVETAGELAFLAAESCMQGQGYFIGRPGSIETYRELVGNSARPAVVVRAPKLRSA